MKKNHIFAAFLLMLLFIFCSANGFAQKKTTSQAGNKKKSGTLTLKDATSLIEQNLKSEVSFVDSKANSTCPNTVAKKMTYEQGVFSNSNLEVTLKDEVKRSVCSLKLNSTEQITSTSETKDETKVSIPMRDLDSSLLKTGSCQTENGLQRTEGNCFFVGLETAFAKKSIKVDRIHSYWFEEKQKDDKTPVSFTTNQFQIFFSDEETANNFAKALAQAIKMSGGK